MLEQTGHRLKKTPQNLNLRFQESYTYILKSQSNFLENDRLKTFLPESISSVFCVSKQSTFFLHVGEKGGPEMSRYDGFS